MMSNYIAEKDINYISSRWSCHDLSPNTKEMAAAAAATAKSLQSCPTLCDPTDSSPPGSAIPGILQARTRKWQPTPIFLPRKSNGQRSLVGYSPWGL